MNSYHLENEEVDDAEWGDEDNQYNLPDNNNQNNPWPDIFDPTGYWRWNVEVQQWISAQPAPQPDAVLNEQDQGVDDGVDDDGENPFLATVRTL